MSLNPRTATRPLPKKPARGSLQGQTTLAARIDRWDGMIHNLLPVLEELPQLQPVHTDLQQTVGDAKRLRDHMRSLKADARELSRQRKELISTGEELFSRLRLGLRFAFGPKSERLTAFDIQPLKTGRPRKLPLPDAKLEVATPPASEPAKE